MGIIRLKNMQFYGFHGVNESEKKLGGRFEVDVELNLSLNFSCLSDDLQDTIDYESVYKIIENCIKKDKFNLIEALANSIAKDIINNHELESIMVRVRKPNAPLNGVLDTVEVEIERKQKDYD